MTNHENRIPRWASSLLASGAPFEDRDSVLGDFEEMYADMAGRRGLAAARAWCATQALKSLPMFFANSVYGSTSMFKTDLKLAVRNLLKSKGFSFLNIAGLALGMAVGFLMLLFIHQETSYDRFHQKSHRIFRLSDRLTIEGREMDISGVPGPFGPLLKETYPQVLTVVRMRTGGTLTLEVEGKKIDAGRFIYAEREFFEMFTARVQKGASESMLEAPFSLVLTDETARNLFGREDPLGRAVKVNDRDSYTVTGVIKGMPVNSHLQFGALASLSTLQKTRTDLDIWMGHNYVTYLELGPGASPEESLPQFQQVFTDNIRDQIEALDIKVELGLVPLTRIHLHSRSEIEFSPPGNPAFIRLLTMIAFFILVLAGINFVNLATARAGRRAKEVGIRKVLGAERGRLVVQFLGESVLLSVISLTAAVGLIYLILPVFNRLIVQNLSFDPFRGGSVVLGLLGMAILVGLLAGLYPAFVLAGFVPQDALKPQSRTGKGHRFFRNGLVTFQYVVSIALICSTLIIQGQLRYVRNFNLGYEKDQLVELPLVSQLRQKRDVFRTEVMQIPGVESASLCSSAPGRVNNEGLFRFEGASGSDRQVLPFVDTNGGFLETLGLSLAAGRDFSSDLPTDRNTAILNETLARGLGWDDPIGKTVMMTDVGEDNQFVEVPLTVIGVVRDYNFESLHAPIRGQLIVNMNRDIESLLAKLRADDIPAAMREIERGWKSIEPDRPFRYTFLSESFDRMYRSEERLGQLFLAFTSMALFVAGLGLFGLAAYTAERRTKEIGIRRTLGASVAGIMVLLTREFVRWVILANVVAWPLAYLAMNKWLESFAFRTGFNPLLFLAAGGITLALAVITVSLKTAKAAGANPVKSLRYE